MWPAETEVMVSQLLSRVWQHKKLSDVSLLTRQWYSLVADEDIQKQKKKKSIQKPYVIVHVASMVNWFWSLCVE